MRSKFQDRNNFILSLCILVFFSLPLHSQSSLDFTGNDTDHVDHGSASTLDDLQTWTKLFWVNFDAWEDFAAIFKKGRSGNEDKELATRANITTGFQIQVRRSGGSDILQTGDVSSNITIGEWFFIGVTYNSGGTSGQRLKCYIGDLNTIAVLQSQDGTGSGTVVDASQTLRVGGNNGTDSINGKIAWFGHWNTEFTLEQVIDQQFAPKITENCIVFTYYGFNDTGTQVDLSGTGNDGTVTGAVVSFEGAPISIGGGPQ